MPSASRGARSPSFRSLAICAAFAAHVAWAGGLAQPVYHQLSAHDIRVRVVGMAITDDAHWSDHFHPGGVLVSYDLGHLKRGTWKLDGDELCLTRAGKKEATDCFEIWASRDGVQYRRDGVVVADAYLRPIPKGERP